jgi:predicted PurR-regulated permease PerM
MNGTAQASRVFYVVMTAVAIVAVMRWAQDVLVPVAIALLMALLLAPLVDRLQRFLGRPIAVLLTVICACALIGTVVYLVIDQLRDLVRALPEYQRQLEHHLVDLSGVLKNALGRTTHLFEQLTAELQRSAPPFASSRAIPKVQVVQPPLDTYHALRQVLGPLLAPVATAAVIVVFVVFMLLNFGDLRDRFIRLLGSRNLRVATEAIDEAARRVSRYLVMQTLINSWEGLCVAVGLSLIGVPNAILWGVLTAVLRFIPYVGIWFAASLPVLMSVASFDHWTPSLLTIALFVGVEAVSYAVLEPWLYSRRTGVSPVALLVAAAFWAWLWGVAGLFLAIPLTVCLVVMGKYIPQLAFLDVLLGDKPVLAPHERLYQRLLASRPEEADDLLDAVMRKQRLREVCDSVVLPALQLVARDHEQGALREGKRKFMLDYLDRWADELIESGARGIEPDPPVPRGARILCLPAGDRSDEIAAKLLAAVLRERGLPAAERRAPERLDADAFEGATIIVISTLPLATITDARHLCRRLHLKAPGAMILVGLWHMHTDLPKHWQRLESSGASRLVTTFAAAETQILNLTAELTGSVRLLGGIGARGSSGAAVAPESHA